MKRFKYDFIYTFYETFGLKNKKIITPENTIFQVIKDTSIATALLWLPERLLKMLNLLIKNIRFFL